MGDGQRWRSMFESEVQIRLMEKLIRALQKSAVNDYKIIEVDSESSELFYVGKKLETNRATILKNIDVTIYVDVDNKRGSATFTYRDYLSEEELQKLINDKIFASKFALNEYYEIPCKNDEKPTKTHLILIIVNFLISRKILEKQCLLRINMMKVSSLRLRYL